MSTAVHLALSDHIRNFPPAGTLFSSATVQIDGLFRNAGRRSVQKRKRQSQKARGLRRQNDASPVSAESGNAAHPTKDRGEAPGGRVARSIFRDHG
jgi:hypothetical protein